LPAEVAAQLLQLIKTRRKDRLSNDSQEGAGLRQTVELALGTIRTGIAGLQFGVTSAFFTVEATGAAAAAIGPLRVHPGNPRYFTDGTKGPDGSLKAVYLTGSHTWANLIDRGPSDPPPISTEIL